MEVGVKFQGVSVQGGKCPMGVNGRGVKFQGGEVSKGLKCGGKCPGVNDRGRILIWVSVQRYKSKRVNCRGLEVRG